MDNTIFDNVMARIRECDRDLQLVSEGLTTALNTPVNQSGTGLLLRVAEEDVIRLRSTVDTITRQLLHRTWSAGFKDRIDESMRPSNWLFPR